VKLRRSGRPPREWCGSRVQRPILPTLEKPRKQPRGRVYPSTIADARSGRLGYADPRPCHSPGDSPHASLSAGSLSRSTRLPCSRNGQSSTVFGHGGRVCGCGGGGAAGLPARPGRTAACRGRGGWADPGRVDRGSRDSPAVPRVDPPRVAALLRTLETDRLRGEDQHRAGGAWREREPGIRIGSQELHRHQSLRPHR